jgi:hypothetical protein
MALKTPEGWAGVRGSWTSAKIGQISPGQQPIGDGKWPNRCRKIRVFGDKIGVVGRILETRELATEALFAGPKC